MDLYVLSAGAAQGVVRALAERFRIENGAAVHGTFGAVGAMRAKLLAEEPCDVVILTAAQIGELERDGRVAQGVSAPIGRVRTGVAVREGSELPDVATPESLRATLLAAGEIFIPDPQLATAGIHFVSVLKQLEIADPLSPRLRSFPNGATAMRELAQSTGGADLGCTQITEIRYTPGVVVAGALPPPFELVTVYTAAVSERAKEPVFARRFLEALTNPGSQALRTASGFE
jgi:molybdate transport system substrate-binding protein